MLTVKNKAEDILSCYLIFVLKMYIPPLKKKQLINGLLVPQELANVYAKSLNLVQCQTFKINFSFMILKVKSEENPFFTNYCAPLSPFELDLRL